MLLLHCPLPLHNDPVKVLVNTSAMPTMQAISMFYYLILHTQYSLELDKASFQRPSRANCTIFYFYFLLLNLHFMELRSTWDPLEKNIGVILCEDQSSKYLVAQLKMLWWITGGEYMSGAMMHPWWHACIQSPWDGLLVHMANLRP